MFALVDHEPVVAPSERRLDAPRPARRHEERLAKVSLTSLGRAAVVSVHARRVERGDETAERAGTGERPEPVRVPETGEDLGAVDKGDTGDRHHDPCGVELVEEDLDAAIEVLDLFGELWGEAGLDGNVVGELAEVNLISPQGECLGCGLKERDCLILAVSSSPCFPCE